MAHKIVIMHLIGHFGLGQLSCLQSSLVYCYLQIYVTNHKSSRNIILITASICIFVLSLTLFGIFFQDIHDLVEDQVVQGILLNTILSCSNEQ